MFPAFDIQENETLERILINEIHIMNNMSAKAWKCYRCNLTFTDEFHADLHEDLSRHQVREIQIVKV